MKIEELSKYGISDFYIKKIKEEKISELYPPQAEVIKKKMLEDKNLIISVPTAGGKTLMALLAIVKKFSEKKCKAIYIAPMVALAREKADYFKEFFKDKYKIALSIGDFDSRDSWLGDYDIIVCTTEKLDSLTRHGARWLNETGIVVIDEIHLMNDFNRGPTLEVLLTKMRETIPKAQIIGLSATIKNVKELSDWLDANLVTSSFRPVELHEGLTQNNQIKFLSHKNYDLPNMETENAIVHNTVQMEKQSLFFVSSRRNAEALAERLAKTVNKMITEKERKQLLKLSKNILGVLEAPSKQCSRLALCIQNGTAFHHAGLMMKQKKLIEDNFREGLIKVITSTPTLALGVNLPAFRVIIRDTKRYYPGRGMAYIPVMEYRQMIGRAGRPKYDDFGEAILIAKSEEDAFELTEKFLQGEVEEIRSKLAMEPVLRMHTLALIASSFARSEAAILEFFSKTFYSFQYGDSSAIDDKIVEILGNLVEWGFIEYSKERIEPTLLGKRVSDLYLDPLTAHRFIENLKNAPEKECNYFSFLQTICSAKEMNPKVSPKASEIAEMDEIITQYNSSILQEIPEDWDLDFEDFVKSVKTSMLFEFWMDEKTDDQILSEFRVAPGEMRGRLQIADWLTYSLQEMSNLLGQKEVLPEIRKLRVRLKYGVKEELLPLVKLRGIGRMRARKLHNSGMKSLDKLRKTSVEKISKVVGKKVAESVKKQVGDSRVLKDY